MARLKVVHVHLRVAGGDPQVTAAMQDLRRTSPLRKDYAAMKNTAIIEVLEHVQMGRFVADLIDRYEPHALQFAQDTLESLGVRDGITISFMMRRRSVPLAEFGGLHGRIERTKYLLQNWDWTFWVTVIGGEVHFVLEAPEPSNRGRKDMPNLLIDETDKVQMREVRR